MQNRIISPYGRPITNNYLKQNIYDPAKDGEMPALTYRLYHRDGSSLIVPAAEYKQAKESGNYFDSPWEAKEGKEKKVKNP